MPVEYTKNLVGKPIVKFDCPECRLRLSAMLSEAGSHEKCPECGQGFRVPGQQKLKQAEEARRLAREAKAAAKLKKLDVAKTQKIKGVGSNDDLSHVGSGVLAQQQAGPTQELDARWLLDPDESQDGPQVQDDPEMQDVRSSESGGLHSSPSGNAEFAVPTGVNEHSVAEHAGDQLADSGVTANAVTPNHGRLAGGGSGRPMNFGRSSSKAWWKDSVRFEDVSVSRYPALMAFRNLMVLLWWIMMICALVGFVGNPVMLMYRGYTTYSKSNRYYNTELEPYSNLTIENLLSEREQGKGLTAEKASRLFAELSKYEYRGFSAQNQINQNQVVSPQVLTSVANAWRVWTKAKTAEINQDRPSGLMSFLWILFLILVYWIAQVVGMVIYSIVILVPPECIKLAIDIEQGVRGGSESPSN